MTGFRIRKAKRADVAAILELEQNFSSDRMSRRSVVRFLSVGSAHVVLAQSKNEILGALVLLTRRNSRVARIYSVVVDPRARGAGLGRALMQSAEREARKRARHSMSLEVRMNAHAARALYRKLGYRELARLPGYYEDKAEALKLGKLLT